VFLPRSLSLQALASLPWSDSTFHERHRPLRDSIASSAIPRITEYTAQNIANTAWAVSVFGYHNQPLRDALAASSRRPLHHELSEQRRQALRLADPLGSGVRGTGTWMKHLSLLLTELRAVIWAGSFLGYDGWVNSVEF